MISNTKKNFNKNTLKNLTKYNLLLKVIFIEFLLLHSTFIVIASYFFPRHFQFLLEKNCDNVPIFSKFGWYFLLCCLSGLCTSQMGLFFSNVLRLAQYDVGLGIGVPMGRADAYPRLARPDAYQGRSLPTGLVFSIACWGIP